MKPIAILACLLVTTTFAHAGATLQKARVLLQEGDYVEAREMYEELVKDAQTRRPATLGLSQTLESTGEYDKAQAVVEAFLKDNAKDADFLARLAELHYTRGRLDEAEKTALTALAQNDEQFLAHWVLGQNYRDRGLEEKADEQFLWFVRISNKKNIDDPESLRLVGLAGLERARLRHLTDQFQTIINDYFGVAEKKDKLYWQATYEAGRVFMEKHNKPAAFRAFERVLTINPRAAAVLVAKGQMAAGSFEFKDADKYAELALKVNPRLVSALNLMAEVQWFSGEIDATMKTAAKARAVNPRDEATLARIAACHFAKRNQKEFDGVVQEAVKVNPKCYVFYTELATLLEQRKFNAEAGKYYETAAKMQPKLADAQTGLGMMYMRMGKEEEARKALDDAARADPFNIRVSNSIIVLKHLDRYETLKTEHFIIRFDAKNDSVLANFMAIYLEEIYKELAVQFDNRPPGPFQIQIFSRHEMFSGRVIAMPDLHTIGACTGPLVAMCSPRETSGFLQKPFNWNRVIRHELVHVFNLEQTKGLVPHWFTEGLAVRYEGPHIPPSWHALLAEKVANNELLDLDNILLGFVRPRSQAQWQQAYLQSLLYVEYLTKTHGEKSIGKMLAAFAEGLDTGPALEKACGVKKEAFEKGYRVFLAEKVKKDAALAPPKALTMPQLKAAHKKNPDDVEIAAMIAERNFAIGKKREAKDLVEAVLRKEPNQPIAVTVKALILIDDGKPDIAYDLLDSIATNNLKDTKPLKLLLRLQLNGKKLPQAARTCERARKIDPHDTYWVLESIKLYDKTRDKDKLIEVLEIATRIDPDALMPRKLLAAHYLQEGKHVECARYARMALEIDVTDGESQGLLIVALAALNRDDEVLRLQKLFGLR